MQFCSGTFPQRGEAPQMESPLIFLWLLQHTHTHSYTLFVAPLSKSLCRLFGNLLLEVKEELIVRQGRLCSVLDHVLHKAGLPLALIPERVNHRKKKKKWVVSLYLFPLTTWQNEFHNHSWMIFDKHKNKMSSESLVLTFHWCEDMSCYPALKTYSEYPVTSLLKHRQI